MGQVDHEPINQELLREYKKEYREFLKSIRDKKQMTRDQKLKLFLMRLKKDKPAKFWEDLRSAVSNNQPK